MKRSQLFIATYKETEGSFPSVSLKLALRSGLLHQMSSGIYAYTTLGFRVLHRLFELVRKEMVAAGAQEILLPALEPRELWEETGRWKEYGNLMFKMGDHCMAPTCEEVVVDMIRKSGHLSYKTLPFTLFQISEKYRNETVRQGLIRTKEFIMKDAYSFNKSDADLEKVYTRMSKAYRKVFDALQLKYAVTSADNGEMGGSGSEEFQAFAEIGTDTVMACQKCEFATLDLDKNTCECGGTLKEQRTVELGHIFKLGDRYSKPMKLQYQDEHGKKHDVLMGCYGIGVSRLIPVLIEQHHDEKGIVWPEAVAPFREVVIATNEEMVQQAEVVYAELVRRGRNVLFDDRSVSAGVKFAEADLLGIPRKIVIGPKSVKQGVVEIEHRDGKKETFAQEDFVTQYTKVY